MKKEWEYINTFNFDNGTWKVYFDSRDHLYKGQNTETLYNIQAHNLGSLVRLMEKHKEK